jgi:GT2 family glycosyltransferase
MIAPLVIAVVLNWNRRDDTLACVASLLESTYQPLRVLVCDNGSVDDTPAAVGSAYPSVEVLELGYNRGFAGGANVGLRYALAAGAEYVLALNNDTFVEPTMIERLVEVAAPDVGIVAPLVYYASAPDTIWSAGGLRGRWTLENSRDRRNQQDRGDWPKVLDQDFVTGCAMLLSKRALATVGLFDERFFMYYEDNDLCLRVRGSGLRILLVPGAKMWHRVAASSGGTDSPAERYLMAESSVLFFRKHVTGWHWLIVTPYRIGSALKTTVQLLGHGKIVATASYWRGLFSGLART